MTQVTERDRAELTELLARKSTIVVVGPGGVGKTTAAAAIAVRATQMGQKVLVLTVDPARRLANALGLAELAGEEVRIPPRLFARAGVRLGSGALHAMMLDTKRTFDQIVERHASSPAVRDRILSNPFYEQASTALAGSQEYMAMEKLYEIRERDDYDLLVLDTPPTRHALDFLEAPRRVEEFLDSGSLRVLLAGARSAGRLGLGLLRFNGVILRGLHRFVGAETLLSLLEFIDSFHEMYDGFQVRARRVKEILRSEDTTFAVVTSTDQAAIDEAVWLYRELVAQEMPVAAMLVNRVRRPFLEPPAVAGLERRLAEAAVRAAPALAFIDAETVERLARETARACRDYAVLAQMDQARVAALRDRLDPAGDRVWAIPLFDRDIHDLGGLAAFAAAVFSGQAPS